MSQLTLQEQTLMLLRTKQRWLERKLMQVNKLIRFIEDDAVNAEIFALSEAASQVDGYDQPLRLL